MPFTADLHYFYLYLAQHIEQRHHLKCVRADSSASSGFMFGKIKQFIETASVIIADCTGNNPNVMYELGIAHTFTDHVILITQDDIENIPTDIRHHEFILYKLDEHIAFLQKLDQAVQEILEDRYEKLYQHALKRLKEFRATINPKVSAATKNIFIERVQNAELQGENLPSLKDAPELIDAFVLPKIVARDDDPEIADLINDWLLRL